MDSFLYKAIYIYYAIYGGIRKFQHIVMCMKTVTRPIRERSRSKIFCRLHTNDTIISLPACDVGVDI